MMNMKLTKLGTTFGRWIIVIGAIFFALFPVYWMVKISLVGIAEWTPAETLWLPQKITWYNWAALFIPRGTLMEMGWFPGLMESEMVSTTATPAVLNSLTMALGGTGIAVAIGTLAAYSMSRYRAGGNFLPYLFLTFRMLPPMAIIVPIVIWYSTLHLFDNRIGIMLLYALFPVPFVIWLMRSFFDEIPKEIDEAAIMDGCTPLASFYKVILPLTRAGVAVTALFIFILDWSDLLIAITLTRVRAVTVTVQLGLYQAEVGSLYGVMAALGIFAIIPTLIFGLAIQRYLVRGFTFGAIKG